MTHPRVDIRARPRHRRGELGGAHARCAPRWRATQWLVSALLAFCAVAASGIRGAQAADVDPHAVQPERPTVATHAHTVAPGWVELESGLERDGLPGSSRAYTVTVVTKVGLTRHTQLNLVTPWVRQVETSPEGSGVADCSAALKWRVLDRAPVLGDFAVMPSIKLPSGAPSRGTGTGTLDASILAISSHAFGPFAVDMNVGCTRRGLSGDATRTYSTLWTVSAGLPSFGPWSGVAEVFGLPGTTGPSGTSPIVAMLLGPTATPRPWLEVDAGLIVPVSGPQPHGLYCGCVWNVGRL